MASSSRRRSRSRSRSRSQSRSRSASPEHEGFSTSMSRQQLVQAGRHMEKKLDKVEEVVDDLKKENAHLKAKHGRRKGRSRKERAAPPEPDALDEDEVDELRERGKHTAQKFLLQCTLFLADGFSTQIKRTPDYDLSPANRFASSEGVVQGQLRDLECILPEDITDEQKTSATFWSLFNFHFGDHRSQAIARRIRGTAGIWGNLYTHLGTVKGRAEQRALIGWSNDGWGTGKPGYAALAAPLIHKDNSAPNGFDIRTAFLNECAMRTYIAIVLGPAAVTALNEHGAAVPAPGEYIGKTLRIKHTTPGGIALACTATCWAMSVDTKLVRQQSVAGTRIDWLAWQNQYQQNLEDGLARGLEEYKNIFRTWDKMIFPATADQGLGGPEPGAPVDVNAVMMQKAREQMAASQANARETSSPSRDAHTPPREDRTPPGTQGATRSPTPPQDEHRSTAGRERDTRDDRDRRRTDRHSNDGGRDPGARQNRRSSRERSTETGEKRRRDDQEDEGEGDRPRTRRHRRAVDSESSEDDDHQ